MHIESIHSPTNLFRLRSSAYEPGADDDSFVSLCCFQSSREVTYRGWDIEMDKTLSRGAYAAQSCKEPHGPPRHVLVRPCTSMESPIIDMRVAKQHQQFISTTPSLN